jgi:hypothetical protein
MKTLRLRLEDLQVDTFQTASVVKERGTVFGNQWSLPEQGSCNNDETCGSTCGEACPTASCEYFTCAGWVSRWGRDQFCVFC